MKIHNRIPLLQECVRDWQKLPGEAAFRDSYFNPMRELLHPMLKDWGLTRSESLRECLDDLNWEEYRDHVVNRMNADAEELRLRNHIANVERCLGVRLGGEAVLFGAFEIMDGYARFDQGTHRVFLGIDEAQENTAYFDILISHELTHVAREPQLSVWQPFGLDPSKMSHDDFTRNLPVVEHLFNEGFACAVSEILVPGQAPWDYVYQEREDYDFIIANAAAIDRVVHEEFGSADPDYGHFYSSHRYQPNLPIFCHYVWAWAWVKTLLATEAQGDPRALLKRSSADFLEHARNFRLAQAACLR